MDRSDNLVTSSWSNICHRRLPKALDSEWYLPQDSDGNDLPLPYFSKPLFDHSTQSLETTGDILGCIPFLQSLLYYLNSTSYIYIYIYENKDVRLFNVI